jgi:hypothetical protein
MPPSSVKRIPARSSASWVSDEFAVPLCRGHQRELHQAGNELAWWDRLNIRPLEAAKGLWEQAHPKLAISDLVQPSAKATGES